MIPEDPTAEQVQRLVDACPQADLSAEDVRCPSHPEVVIGKATTYPNGNWCANLVMCGKCWPVGLLYGYPEQSDGGGADD